MRSIPTEAHPMVLSMVADEKGTKKIVADFKRYLQSVSPLLRQSKLYGVLSALVGYLDDIYQVKLSIFELGKVKMGMADDVKEKVWPLFEKAIHALEGESVTEMLVAVDQLEMNKERFDVVADILIFLYALRKRNGLKQERVMTSAATDQDQFVLKVLQEKRQMNYMSLGDLFLPLIQALTQKMQIFLAPAKSSSMPIETPTQLPTAAGEESDGNCSLRSYAHASSCTMFTPNSSFGEGASGDGSKTVVIVTAAPVDEVPKGMI